jgi:hypothetical protein
MTVVLRIEKATPGPAHPDRALRWQLLCWLLPHVDIVRERQGRGKFHTPTLDMPVGSGDKRVQRVTALADGQGSLWSGPGADTPRVSAGPASPPIVE